MKKNIIYIGVFLFIFVLSSLYFLLGNKSKNNLEQQSLSTPTKLQIIDEHLSVNEELRSVNFCGKILKVKQISVNETDVIQRIAELATNNLIPTNLKEGVYQEGWRNVVVSNEKMQKVICENVTRNNPSDIINVSLISKLPLKETEVSFPKEQLYSINIAQEFIVSVPTGNIYLKSGFDGTLTGPIGKLK